MLQPSTGSTTAHTADPPPRPNRGTELVHSWTSASDRTDRHGRIRHEEADARLEARAIQILDALGMPRHEARAVAGADDPMVLRRYMELHAERVAERLADQLETLARLERTLSQGILHRRSASPGVHRR